MSGRTWAPPRIRLKEITRFVTPFAQYPG